MIYNLFLWKNNPIANKAHDNSTEEEQKALDEVLSDAAMACYGADWVLYCDSAWASEEYRNWGITSYRTMEGRIAQTRALQKAGWFNIAEMQSLMGTLEMQEGVPQKPDYPNPVYQLWIIKTNPITRANYGRLTKEEEAALWAGWQESMKLTNGCMVLYCKSGWCNEEFASFGVTAFPSVEARQQHYKDLDQLNWWLYFDVYSLLGVNS